MLPLGSAIVAVEDLTRSRDEPIASPSYVRLGWPLRRSRNEARRPDPGGNVMKANGLGSAPSMPKVFDRALTNLIRSRRLVEETEAVLAEALEVLRTLDGPASAWPASVAERVAWTQTLDGSIDKLTDVRDTLRSLLSRSRPQDS